MFSIGRNKTRCDAPPETNIPVEPESPKMPGVETFENKFYRKVS
jgi:hypothetical protein